MWRKNPRAPLLLVPKWILGDANLAFTAALIEQDAKVVLVLRCTGGEIDFIDMWQYRFLILNVHLLFFAVAVNLLVAELSDVHDPAFLFLLKCNMFHQVLQGEKDKTDGFKDFLIFIFIV